MLGHAALHLVPRHLDEVKRRKEELVAKTRAAVHDRLTKEIIYWDHRAAALRAQEQAGRTPRLNSARADARVEDLEVRLRRRMDELDQELRLAAVPPVVIGGALVVPGGLLARLAPDADEEPAVDAEARARIERLAMDAVMAEETRLGHHPRDVSALRVGYDVESRDGTTGRLRFIEVKRRIVGARTVTVTHNETRYALNTPDDFIFAVVVVGEDGVAERPVYVRCPFQREPDFGVTSVTYRLDELLARGEVPT